MFPGGSGKIIIFNFGGLVLGKAVTGEIQENSMLSFVCDGYERACDGVRAEVEKKYARRLKAATPEGRKILIAKIEAEVKEMMKRKATPDGLY